MRPPPQGLRLPPIEKGSKSRSTPRLLCANRADRVLCPQCRAGTTSPASGSSTTTAVISVFASARRSSSCWKTALIAWRRNSSFETLPGPLNGISGIMMTDLGVAARFNDTFAQKLLQFLLRSPRPRFKLLRRESEVRRQVCPACRRRRRVGRPGVGRRALR